MAKKTTNFEDVREIAMTLPEVEEGVIHGAPSLKLRGKLLACPALHKSAEPETLAVRISLDQRAELMAAQPEVYYVTTHYFKYPTLLVRLGRVDRKSLRKLLVMAWDFVASNTKASGRQTGDRRPPTSRS